MKNLALLAVLTRYNDDS